MQAVDNALLDKVEVMNAGGLVVKNWNSNDIDTFIATNVDVYFMYVFLFFFLSLQ